MYGLIIEGVRYMIIENFGNHILEQVLVAIHMTDQEISTHDLYSEHIVPNMFKALCELTGMTTDQIGILAGRFFVQFLIRHGYGDLMNVMGRRFSDFLKGLDNIHEYFRLSYPKIRPPSFHCSSENENGLVLHYRSRRKGYIAYVMGQLLELAKLFYKQEVGLQVLKKTERGKFLFVVISLTFNNSAIGKDITLRETVQTQNEYLPVDTYSFLKMFPFFIAFDRNLQILVYGQGLHNLMPNLCGHRMDVVFNLLRPCIKFTAEGCLAHGNCNFQLESLQEVRKTTVDNSTEQNGDSNGKEKGDENSHVNLRGPVVYLKHCNIFLLLATCVSDDLDSMFRMGLYLNDFGDADCNKEIIMASIQKSDHLKSMLNAEKQRSRVLADITKEIRETKKKTKELMGEMMPPDIASTYLRTGTANKCESIECVTVAFATICEFTKLVERLTAAEIASSINSVHQILDAVVDVHGCYKVETIGDQYLFACGVPNRNDYDAEVVLDACLQMVSNVKEAELKSGTDNFKIVIKIGVHSGPVTAGVVGQKTPQYMLFGETITVASKIEEDNPKPNTIRIGQRVKDRVDKQTKNTFKIKSRGSLALKGKRDIKVYDVVTKNGRPRYVKDPPEKNVEEEPIEIEEDVEAEMDGHSRTSVQSRMSISSSTDSIRSAKPLDKAKDPDESMADLNATLAREYQIAQAKAVESQKRDDTAPPPRPLPHLESSASLHSQLEKRASEIALPAHLIRIGNQETPQPTKDIPDSQAAGGERTTETFTREASQISLAGSESEMLCRGKDEQNTFPHIESTGSIRKKKNGDNTFISEEQIGDFHNDDDPTFYAGSRSDSKGSQANSTGDIQTEFPIEDVLSETGEEQDFVADLPTRDSLASMKEDAQSIAAQSEGDNQSITSMSNTLARTDTQKSFATEPVDKIPSYEPVADSDDDLLDELSRNTQNFAALKRSSKKPKKKEEIEAARRLVESQKRIGRNFTTKSVLPKIGEKSSSATKQEDDCKCEEIKKDPKLKTKVCSIM